MAFTEDFASYFVDFGVTATVDGVSVRGIFDNDFLATLGVVAGSPACPLPALAAGGFCCCEAR